MKKLTFAVFSCLAFMLAINDTKAQTIKVGVFDIDVMVQAMPNYRQVDSLVQIFERDSLGAEYEYNQSEYQRLDSTYKADSALVAQGKKSQTQLNFTIDKRREVGLNLVYWQQIARNKSDGKRSQIAQPLYNQVITAYKKVLDRKKYNVILKPQTYEAGFAIDNIFLSVARELKLTSLPQQLLQLGDDPDAGKQPATSKPATGGNKLPAGNKPKTN
jgi:Skp family chaperone for outer membrane proteins